MKLLIHDVELKDAGEYTCVCGEQETTAALIVHGKKHIYIYIHTSVLLFVLYQRIPIVVCLPVA